MNKIILTLCLIILSGTLLARDQQKFSKQKIARLRALNRLKLLSKACCIICKQGHNVTDDYGVCCGPLKCIMHHDGSIHETDFIHQQCFNDLIKSLGNHSCPVCDDAHPVAVVKPDTLETTTN